MTHFLILVSTFHCGVSDQAATNVPALVFSVRTWQGEFFSKDIPGGVETTPVVGAIYTVGADGKDLKKIAQLGKNTDFPTYSPDRKWVYFQSNGSGR